MKMPSSGLFGRNGNFGYTNSGQLESIDEMVSNRNPQEKLKDAMQEVEKKMAEFRKHKNIEKFVEHGSPDLSRDTSE